MQDDIIIHNFGRLIKAARLRNELTRDQLSERIGIGYRHLMGIENENKSPSFDVLFRLIRELGISADSIFYPEKNLPHSERDRLHKMLSLCTEREIRVVIAMLDVLIANRE